MILLMMIWLVIIVLELIVIKRNRLLLRTQIVRKNHKRIIFKVDQIIKKLINLLKAKKLKSNNLKLMKY